MNQSSSKNSEWSKLLMRAALAMMILLILVFGTVSYVVVQAVNTARDIALMPQQVVNQLADAFSPKVNVSTVVRTAIGNVRTTPKLVVMTAEVDAEVIKSKTTEWGYFYWGNTQVTLRAHENRIQYVIETKKITPENLHYDARHKELRLKLPQPMVDPEVVDVQSDPRKIEVKTELGWAHFDKWSGKPLRQEAQQDLRQAVIGAGQSQLLREEARRAAQKELVQLLAPMADKLAPGVKLVIEFKEITEDP